MSRHFLELPLTVHRDSQIERVAPVTEGFQITLATPAGRALLEVDAIVLATGMRPRATPELTALAAKSGRVIVGPLSDTIRDGIRGGRVLILGGGDNALDHALYLAERGNRAVVCARRDLSARRQFREACQGNPKTELRQGCQPLELGVDANAVRVRWADGGWEEFDWLLVMYGYQPNTEVLECFAPAIRPRLLPGGHVQVDGWQRTSVAGLYAAGDLTDSPQPSVPTAIAQGLAAARAIERQFHDVLGGAARLG